MRPMISTFLVFAVLMGFSAQAGPLDGLWFSCEYAHSTSPPSDGCQVLDDDGFLVRGGEIAYVKIENGDPTGCRGDRAGHCFNRSRQRLKATTMGIGEVVPTEDGGIVRYLWCDQAYTVTQRKTHAEVRATGERCLWTSDKTYYVARWAGEIIIDD
jgi:hypothetical protein